MVQMGQSGHERSQTRDHRTHLNLPIAVVNLTPTDGILSRAGVCIHCLLSYRLHQAKEIISLLQLIHGSFIQ